MYALCILFLFFYNCCLAAKFCPALHNSMDCSMPGSSVLQRNLLKFMSIESVMLSNHFILCSPLLLSPSVFPSIRVFSNESGLQIRWPNYLSFSFSVNPSNEYSEWISFRTDWFDLLAVQSTQSFLQHHNLKVSILGCSAFFMVQLPHPYMTSGKIIALSAK